MVSSEVAGSYGNCIFRVFIKLHTGEGDGQEVQKGRDICIHIILEDKIENVYFLFVQEISFSENCLEKTSLLGGSGSSIVTKDLIFGNATFSNSNSKSSVACVHTKTL